MNAPSLEDVEAARPRVYAHLQPTPLLRHPLLDEWIGCETWVKHENHNPTGAFKIRGGLNLDPLITHRIPAAEFQKGFDAIKAGNAGKVVMSWD